MNVSLMRDGLCLRGIMQKPNCDKCPMVILFHGFSGDLGYDENNIYARISKRLYEEGIATIRFDFNGHGRSDGDFSQMTVLSEILDAIAILQYVRSLEFVSEVYVIGHSQGGVVGGMLAGYYSDIIKKLVLLAPAANLKDDALNGKCMDSVYDTNHIPDKVVVGKNTVGGQFFRVAKLLPIYEVTSEFKGPTLIIHGIHDKVVDKSVAEKYASVLKQSTLRLYEDLNHILVGSEQADLIEEVISFLLK